MDLIENEEYGYCSLIKATNQVMEKLKIEEIRQHCKEQLDTLWDEVTRFENPHTYYVDLSRKLWDCKRSLLEAAKQR